MNNIKYFRWKGSFNKTFGINKDGMIDYPDYLSKYTNNCSSNLFLSTDILGRLILCENNIDTLIAHDGDYVVYVESKDFFSPVSPKLLNFLIDS